MVKQPGQVRGQVRSEVRSGYKSRSKDTHEAGTVDGVRSCRDGIDMEKRRNRDKIPLAVTASLANERPAQRLETEEVFP